MGDSRARAQTRNRIRGVVIAVLDTVPLYRQHDLSKLGTRLHTALGRASASFLHPDVEVVQGRGLDRDHDFAGRTAGFGCFQYSNLIQFAVQRDTSGSHRVLLDNGFYLRAAGGLGYDA